MAKPKLEHAALYMRSSKDKAEVGLDIQRRDLKAFAKAKGYIVAAEFSDMEISGSLDETARPGLRQLLAALRDPAREWSVILALDTSRIARDPLIAIYVKREAEKVGVDIRFSKMDIDGDSAFGEMMLNVARSFDRLHARLSAEKGRSGLEANVGKGFRAGGRAPLGYKLQHHDTGAVRSGAPVRKSTLVLDKRDARKVKAFLEARAAGVPRTVAAVDAGLRGKAVATLVGIERNALTYAGFTVWNQRRKVKPTKDDPRRSMEWRPRAEWVVSEEHTHEALITKEEAERLLALHEDRARKRVRVYNADDFLLAGLLFTPDGRQWTGDAHDKAYRIRKGQRINAPWVESEVLLQVSADMRDKKFLARIVQQARSMGEAIQVDPVAIEGDIKKAEKKLANVVDLVAETGDRALLAKMRELEGEVAKLREAKATWAEQSALKARLLALSEKDVNFALAVSGLEIRDGAGSWEGDFGFSDEHRIPADQLRRVLNTLASRITLDPETRDISIHYRLRVPAAKATGTKMASPRGFEPRLPP
ncbi:MAG: hypothetical protein BroJett006_09550 [Betaproteobacteria bacterium]|nr:MAG: hypothetical protein BroJett006_09550 [Betaproteobacteria bacterium]